jgi:hypothetical protein
MRLFTLEANRLMLLPAPEPRFARKLPMIPPLPFRRGEGRGEGSTYALGFRGAKRVKMSGRSLPFLK